MDLAKTVFDAVGNLVGSGAIENAIEEQLKKTISDVIRSELREYSDFGKALSVKVKQALAIHGDIDMPSYNDTIVKIIRKQIKSEAESLIHEQVVSRLGKLLWPAPREIKLTELVEAFIDQLRERESAGCICYGETREIYLEVERSDSGWKWIYLGDDPTKRRYECGYQIGCANEGRVYSVRFTDRDTEKQIFAGPFYGFEEMLFQMKAIGTKLIFDADVEDIETTWGLEATH